MAPIDKPRIIVAVMIDEPSNGQYYGGAVAAPVFSEVVQQTLRMMGVQPDMAVKPQIVADGGGVVLMQELHHPAEAARWLRQRVTGHLHADSRKVGPGDGFIAWPGAATDGRRHVPAALAQGAAPAWWSRTAWNTFGFTATPSPPTGLKAATGPIAAPTTATPSQQSGCAGGHRHQRQDLDRLVAGPGAIKFAAAHA
jgi:hypothetical protein